MLKYYTGNIYPSEDTIFVFGSNPEGIHGAGSAKVALLQNTSGECISVLKRTRIRSLKLHTEINQMKRHYVGIPGPNYKVVLKTRGQFQIMFGFRKSGLRAEI